MGVRVIDVSRWQNQIDWRAVKADGVQGAWIKVGGTEGGKHYTDPRAGENLAGAEAAGLPYGTYYFCTPRVGDARQQAQHAVLCGHGRGQLLPAADLEVNPNGLSQAQYDQWASEFCAEVHRQIERESVIYTYSGARLVGYTGSAPGHCRLWIANYGKADTPGTLPPNFNPGIPPAWDRWDAWQFNSTTRVPGIPGNTVDQNVVTDDFWNEMTNEPSIEEDDVPVEMHFLTTRPGSAWFEAQGGEPGTQGMFTALNTDQFVRHLAPAELDGFLLFRAWLDAIEAQGGKVATKLVFDGEVDDWLFTARTLLPRVWPTPTPAVVSLTPQQIAEMAAKIAAATSETDAESLADELAERLAD